VEQQPEAEAQLTAEEKRQLREEERQWRQWCRDLKKL
jgi:hypothetical protein